MNEVQPIRDISVIVQIKNYLKVKSFRDYIFFSMGIHSGLRVSDLLKLQVGTVRDQSHINFVADKTKKRNKKRKKKKFIIHSDYHDDLMLYIQDLPDDAYLFASRQRKTITGAVGEPIRRETAWKMLNDVAARFGLENIGTHSLRKTWGYQLIMSTPPNEAAYTMALLMEMFGHETQEETLRYLGLTQDAMDRANLRMSFT
ncbi:site-specific integrase [Paenibacillaceae bacterium]|nr:site-specific integrase [Paenibacillaceae bacterium]